MDIVDYLKEYGKFTLKEKPFNECDALVMSLIVYFPFYLIKSKRTYNTKYLLDFLKDFKPLTDNQRKRNEIALVREFCTCERFKKAKFIHFERERDDINYKQFQAVSVVINDYLFLAFSGTDGTVIGWREDANMACVEMVPAEEEAIKYAKQVSRFVIFKKMVLCGHSKGGRLAIRSAVNMEKKNKVVGVYNFDGPNFSSSFYETDSYKQIEDRVFEYAPNRSIIGRLFSTPRNIVVVKSKERFFMQHDAYSWEIDNDKFVVEEEFSPISTRLVTGINNVMGKYDSETKQRFVNFLFDNFFADLQDEDFSKSGAFKTRLKAAFISLPREFKNVSREDRDALTRILLSLVKEIVIQK